MTVVVFLMYRTSLKNYNLKRLKVAPDIIIVKVQRTTELITTKEVAI